MSTAKHVREMEHAVAAALGGRRTPLSGAGMVKGDGRVLRGRTALSGPPGGSGGYRIECKWTAAPSYRLTYAVWRKLVQAANEAQEDPIFVVRVRALDKLNRETFAVVRVSLAKRLGILTRSTALQTTRPSWAIDTASTPTSYFLGDHLNYESLALVHFGDLADAIQAAKAGS